MSTLNATLGTITYRGALGAAIGGFHFLVDIVTNMVR